ncbi:prolipoprotein diacylglyceryl transferase [Proteiniphilum acetatigenes]|uniref:prolipoprotein diacylglyceryl transferase n=1 Tax=Proteiniphilum acetatigenes TaxID=294710 RepID=UPI000368F32C|nr:prolipoprotein diacylglyceryl transferase [Proteiniphilum acetatigenes]SFK45371.1 prolipoprotein diacylglyceryl transferase [Porphyromonadaceae bacterium KH3CP3RA]
MNGFLYIHWDVNPKLIDANGFSLGYYSLLFVGGLILSAWIVRKIFQKEGLSDNDYEKLALYCVVGIVLGARLGHCLFYQPDYYLKHPLEMILPFSWEGGRFVLTGYRGLASHGGAIGLIIAVLVFNRKTGIHYLTVFDYIAIAVPLGGAFIRLGNLMNSEIIGNPTNVPWAFIFERIDQVPRHPAQLYEAIAYLIFFVLVYNMYTKKRKTLKRGFLFGLVLMLIFTFRFFIEFLKQEQVDFERGLVLNMGQWLSIPFILLGVYLVFFYKEPIKE